VYAHSRQALLLLIRRSLRGQWIDEEDERKGEPRRVFRALDATCIHRADCLAVSAHLTGVNNLRSRSTAARCLHSSRFTHQRLPQLTQHPRPARW
jgi:hypothetical protein